MPCTRSMVRSESKPSNGPGVSRMPPPSASGKGSTRSTRNKKTKTGKRVTDEDFEVETGSLPDDSPASTSTSSKRSTRAATRSKVKTEPVTVAPESPTPVRSTRQKKLASNKTAGPLSTTSKAKGRENKVLPQVDSKVATTKASKLQTELIATTAAKPDTSTGTKTRLGRAKAIPLPEESSTDEDNIELQELPKKPKGFTDEQIYKQFVLPMKTSLEMSVCEAFGRCMEKIKDNTTPGKLNEAFLKLKMLAKTDMPPPPAPTTKGKGRKKRARSPTPAKADLLSTFNFAQSSDDILIPAKKKMIMDTPSLCITNPSQSELSRAKKNELESYNGSVSHDEEARCSSVGTNSEKDVEETIKVKKEKKVKKVKKETEMEVEIVKGKGSQTTVAAAAEVFSKSKQSSESLENNNSKKFSNTSPDETNQEHCESVSRTKNNYSEQSKNGRDLSESGEKADTADEQSIPMQKSSLNRATPLDQTFVFDTPTQEDSISADKPKESTFTPELFAAETPKSARSQPQLNETVVISKEPAQPKDKAMDVDDGSSEHVLAPPGSASPLADNSSAGGKVSSLVNFFDNKKQAMGGKSSSSKIISESDNSPPQSTANSNNPNATFVLPSSKMGNSKPAPPSMLNVTVCLKKSSLETQPQKDGPMLTPVLPPSELNSLKGHSADYATSALPEQEAVTNKTFLKEATGLAILEEEEEYTDVRGSAKSDKLRGIVAPKAILNKDIKKGISSSSSSSCSSMKSAVSQPCLSGKKNLTGYTNKNAPTYGSAGKLHETNKSKPLEEAEKRRMELLQQKVENSKKKQEEWKKKTEKNKLEEEKKMKEKQKAAASSAATNVLKKPILMSKPVPETGGSAYTFAKPKVNFGAGLPKKNPLPPLSKFPFHKPVLPPPTVELDADDSFKTASNSFLDATGEGHLSSYDITMYEDLDEDLKHRENKTVPKWASNKEELTAALFSMVLLPDYQYKSCNTFPKPDKNYKLFPNKVVPH